MKIKVGVIFGGATVEHEVSIISALQAIENMDTNKYEVIPIYIDKDRQWYTGKLLTDITLYQDFDDLKRYAKPVVLYNKKGKFYLQSLGFFKRNIAELDIAFPIVHGNNAEDGTLAGYLDTIGIPYVGSHVLGSAMGQDKVVMKQVLDAADLPIVKYTWFYDTEYQVNKEQIQKEIKKLGYPIIVKPATLGSSVGIVYVKDEDQLEHAIEEAMEYDTKIVVEKAVENLVEVNESVLGDYEYQDLSEIEEVISTDEFLTYQDKYIGNGKGTKKGGSKGMVNADRRIPARISDSLKEEVRTLAKETFRALNLSGLCRIDFLIDQKNEKVYVNEPNTIPGSLAYYLWEPTGKPYKDLLDDLITLAIKDYRKKNKKITSFDTNILNQYNGIKGVKGLKGVKNKLK